MSRSTTTLLIASCALAASLAMLTGQSQPATQPAGTQPAGAGKAPASNLDYWLRQAKPTTQTTQPATQKNTQKTDRNIEEGHNPFGSVDSFLRKDALPGVIRFSNGKLLAGGIYTTLEKPWLVYVEKEKRWRMVPPITVLSITAVVGEEKMVPEWRWKAMGEPERVYTGKEYPTRRFQWRLRLIDGSEITGTIKGQPVWVERNGKKHGPFVLHERSKGKVGQKLSDLVYIEKIFISRRLMDKVIKAQAAGSR